MPRLFPATPPPGPFRREFWSSPLRGAWLTSFLGSVLLVFVTIDFVTGVLSHAAYNPHLPANQLVDPARDLQPFVIDWPSSPAWLYALNQGLHVVVGVAGVPILLAKLWSVFPRLFAWPPAATPAQAIERLSIGLLVGSTLLLFATGILNIQLDYAFGFSFVAAHYYAAWVFAAALCAHVAVKAATIRRAYRTHGVLAPLRASLEETRVHAPSSDDPLEPVAPAAPTMSRRGLFALAGGGSALLTVLLAGQSIGGPARSLALLAPRRRASGPRPNDFPVNKTAATARVTAAMTGAAWRLALTGPDGDGARMLTRDELLALELGSEELPLACVEGWTTSQRWTGVRLADLARLAGAEPGRLELFVESLQPRGGLRQATLSADQVANRRSLLALRVNDADLSLDHGYPARIIVPALPGVHNTKWVKALTFKEPA